MLPRKGIIEFFLRSRKESWCIGDNNACKKPLTWTGSKFVENIKRNIWSINSMILSFITNSSFLGYTVEMHFRRIRNQSTRLEGNNELGLKDAIWVSSKKGMISFIWSLAMSFEYVNLFFYMPHAWIWTLRMVDYVILLLPIFVASLTWRV